MSFETYEPKRHRPSNILNGVAVSRNANGAITITWNPDVFPGVDRKDRVSLMIGKGSDAGKLAVTRSTNGEGYTVGKAGPGAKANKITFTPPCVLRFRAPSENTWYHSANGLLVLSVPAAIRASMTGTAQEAPVSRQTAA